jgi:hypothetical protein
MDVGTVALDLPCTFFMLRSERALPIVEPVAKTLVWSPGITRLADKVVAGMQRKLGEHVLCVQPRQAHPCTACVCGHAMPLLGLWCTRACHNLPLLVHCLYRRSCRNLEPFSIVYLCRYQRLQCSAPAHRKGRRRLGPDPRRPPCGGGALQVTSLQVSEVLIKCGMTFLDMTRA